jgi:hypothetical protein
VTKSYFVVRVGDALSTTNTVRPGVSTVSSLPELPKWAISMLPAIFTRQVKRFSRRRKLACLTLLAIFILKDLGIAPSTPWNPPILGDYE